MIGLLLRLVLKLGVPARIAEPVAKVVLVVGAAALLIAAFLIWDHFDDKAAVDQHEAEREAKASPARENAANERVADALRNARSEEELHDVIEAAPKGGELSPAARALSCERLRRLGRVPPACGPAGGNGSQAAPD